jgi:hypothetical protein
VLKLLHTFFAAVGNPPTVDGALAIMAKALLSKATVEQISTALDACMFEKFPVRLPHVLERIPGLDVDANAEKRLAWDVATAFADKWVRWNSDRTVGLVEPGAPELSPRLVDAVRRSGGWSVYLRMSDDHFPWVQKRFFEEYEAWVEVQAVAADPARVLEMPKLKQLAAEIPRPAPSFVRNLAQPAEPFSPQKARIMKAIANAGKPRRL